MVWSRAFLVFICVVVAGACAGNSSTPRLNANRISSEEIEEARRHGLNNAYDLIHRARPRWLQIRNERSLRLETAVLVYQNDTRIGGVDILRNFPLDGISSIRYLDAAQAGSLPGAGSAHIEGAIVIATTLRGGER